MAKVLLPNYMLILSRSISQSSKFISSKYWPRLIPSKLNQVKAARMTSTASANPEPTAEDVEPNHTNANAINSRPSIIKSVTSTDTPIIKSVISTAMPNNSTIVHTIQRPSVICTVKNSVLVENKLLPETVLKVEEKPEPEVVDLSVEKSANEENTGSGETVEQSTGNEEKVQRVRTKKFVLMLSYSGTGYLGMQRNPGTKTIEDDLFQSLLKNKYIDQESCDRPQLMNFQRAARTDKGVSAARQIVSLKLPDHATIESINQYLPKQIRVQGMKRVTKGFDSKNSCDGRTYSYMIPTFAFVPVDQQVTESYRITPEVLETVRQKLAAYIGCKNYHNFTSRKKPGDPSAQRIIMSFTCSDPFIQEGLEFVVLRVKGQSFMMHQIRKMIGLVTAIVRGFANDDVMEKAFSLQRIDIPRAPGLGLMLDQVHYERYDKRFGEDGCHEALQWDDLQPQIEEFCKEYIYSNVTKTENEEKPMFHWLETLAYHTYDVREHEPLVIDGKLINQGESAIGKAARKAAAGRDGSKGSNEDSDGDELENDDDEIPQPKKAKHAASS